MSIEALMLWAALAGMLALFTPAFAHAMDAYTLLARTNQYTAFADELQANVNWLSFSAPGSQVPMRVPNIERMEIIIIVDEIEITFEDDSFSQEKMRTISSPIPIEGEIPIGKTITLVREDGKITIN